MKTAIAQIVARIRAEADLADRPGQYDRLNLIALDLETFALAFQPERGGDA